MDLLAIAPYVPFAAVLIWGVYTLFMRSRFMRQYNTQADRTSGRDSSIGMSSSGSDFDGGGDCGGGDGGGGGD